MLNLSIALLFTLHSYSPLEVSPFQANAEDIWKSFLKVQYDIDDNGAYVPKFNAQIKALDGKTIEIKGYMYPLEESSKHAFFMLSYYPINICFFCGGAGPESIVEVSAAKAIPYSSKPIRLRGKLRLNSQDRDRLFFILLNAEVIK